MPGMAGLTAAVITRVLLVGLSAQTLPSPTSALPREPAPPDGCSRRCPQGKRSTRRFVARPERRASSLHVGGDHGTTSHCIWAITRFGCNARSHLRGSDKADHRNGDGAGLQHQSHRWRQIHRTPDYCSTEVAGPTQGCRTHATGQRARRHNQGANNPCGTRQPTSVIRSQPAPHSGRQNRRRCLNLRRASQNSL